MNWSPAQQGMLAAMGYSLLRRVPASAAAGAGSAPPAPAPASDAHPRLADALRRTLRGADPGALPLPPLDQLRASAAAKRALWPTLRALRRR